MIIDQTPTQREAVERITREGSQGARFALGAELAQKANEKPIPLFSLFNRAWHRGAIDHNDRPAQLAALLLGADSVDPILYRPDIDDIQKAWQSFVAKISEASIDFLPIMQDREKWQIEAMIKSGVR